MSEQDQNTLKSLYYLLEEQIVVTMEEMKKVLGTNTRMTVFRKLKKFGYCTSYSHGGGRYYALKRNIQFDKRGLWSFGDAHFSKYGTLKETIKALIENSERGYSASELTALLKVETSRTLWEMHLEGSIEREKFEGVYIYYTGISAGRKRRQQLMRTARNTSMSDEVKAAIIIFYSLLDEKERRLFSGLESLRLGHGGDREVAQLLGLDVHTVAKGRKEIVAYDTMANSQRRKGSGRKSIKKNARNRDCD